MFVKISGYFNNASVVGWTPWLTRWLVYPVMSFIIFEALLRLMEEINPVKVDHKIVTGDFNFPEVNWQNYTTTESENGISFRFIEKIRDGFLHQHVMEATRFRGNSATNTLDLIFTSDDSIIDNIRFLWKE